MGQILVQNGLVSATGFANNAAAANYVKANGSTPAALTGAAAAGAIPPLPTTSPPFIAGVAVPQQTGVSNPPVATASLAPTPTVTQSPPTSGGTDSGSIFNLGSTSKAEQKTATAGDATVKTFKVLPTTAFAPPPAKEVIDQVLADWYRYGRPDEQQTGLFQVQPRAIDPFEYDETPASIRVFGILNGKDSELVPRYTKFILESVQEAHNERSQIVETFGDFYVFLFGERPPMYQFTGTLINTKSVNWTADFKLYYDSYLRGSKCAELKARLLITYGGRQIEGFMLGMNTATDASLEAGVKVSFPVVVTRKTFLGFSDDFGFLSAGGKTVKDPDFAALLDKIAGKEGKGTSTAGTSQAIDVTKKLMAGDPPAGLMGLT